MAKNSFKRSLVTAEGTQLQMVGAFDGLIFKDELKKGNMPIQFNDEIQLNDDNTGK